MKEQLSVSGHEMQIPSDQLGEEFIERWFIPEILSEKTLDPRFLKNVGETLKYIGKTFPKYVEPHWQGHNPLENKLSILNLADLQGDKDNSWQGGNTTLFKQLWKRITDTLDTDTFYIPKGIYVSLSNFDLLVTTPTVQAKNHVKEAEDAKKYFKETGKIDHYWRKYWPPPKNLKVGSKLFYVDSRAIRGFGVVTNIVMRDLLEARMLVNTWRWIKPIPCDYSLIKPPQSYAKASEHIYLKDIKTIKIIGEWLDPMPK